jgi:Cu-Zn family superoxide dismutase
MRRTLLVAALLPLAACSPTPPAGQTPPARALTADLVDAGGRSIGAATITQADGFVRVTVTASGLQPGLHGLHVHAVGVCTPPDFASAGPHFNPLQRRHGWQNPGGPHAGDLRNLEVGADGRARYESVSQHLTLVGPTAIVADSAALVVHAQTDDQVTDPTGNSGARIACGVLRSAVGRRAPPG